MNQERYPVNQCYSGEPAEPGGLPPRRVRHQQKKQKLSLVIMKWGFYPFCAVFLSVSMYEMVQAQLEQVKMAQLHTAMCPCTDTKLPAHDAASMHAVPAPIAIPVNGGFSAPAKTTDAIATKKSTKTSESLQKNLPVQQSQQAGKAVVASVPAVAKKTSTPVQVKPVVKAVAAKPKPLVKRHVVKKGDTLFKLSRYYYHHGSGVQRIAAYNRMNPNAELRLGKVLYIPLGSK